MKVYISKSICFRIIKSKRQEGFKMKGFLIVLGIVLLILLVLLAVMYFLGRKLQKKQAEQQEAMDAAAQQMNLYIIDMKMMKITEANLPKVVLEQVPKYMKRAKLPIVKAKIGPKVMTLIADEKAFLQLPTKTEAKVIISGLYITDVKSVRGGIPPLPKKKGFFARFKKDKGPKKA